MYVNMQSECIIFSNETGMIGWCSLSHEMLPEKELSKTLLLFLQMK